MADETKCNICQVDQRSIKKLHEHIPEAHPETTVRQYYVQKMHGGTDQLCACGCGEPVTFHAPTRKFMTYVKGHLQRVKNPWGHNKKALEKSIETRRKNDLFNHNPTWNAGLTKETDERLKKLGQTISDRHGEEYSKRMTENRLNGTIPTLWGPDHPQWKGGTSSLSAECHGDGRLYAEWKYPKLKAAGFKCGRCGSTDRLCVHHDKERMATIIHRMVEKFGYDGSVSSHEEKCRVVEAVVEYHLQNDVSGEVICHGCHEEEHPGLNF